MPHEPQVGTPVEWLRRAKSNLIRAQQPRPEGVCWEDLCFDAQQAVEKALKALLVHRNIPFRYVHDIAELLTLVEQSGIRLPEDVRLAAGLSDYAVAARYPGPMEPVTEEEYQEAIALAEAVLRWVEQLLRFRQEPPSNIGG
jgi:HEPN domain-containing protein